MNAERDVKVPALVDASFADSRTKVKNNLETYLTTASKAEFIRNHVKAKAVSEIENSMTRGTAEQRQDALKYAVLKAEGIMLDKLRAYASEVAAAQFSDAKKIVMTAEANKAFDLVTPSLSQAAFEKQKTGAAADSQKKLNTLAKTLIAEAVKDATAVITAKFTPSVPGGAAGFDHIDAGTAGTDELEQRMNLDGDLVRDIRDMETVYQTSLFNPLKNEVLLKLGVGRRAFRRSKELNQYRETLKEAARTKVRAEIDTEIASRNGGASSSTPMRDEYLKMASKVMAHQESKILVDNVMKDEADTILERIIPKDQTVEKLTAAGKSSAYDIARKDRTQRDKIQAAGIAAAKVLAEKILKEKKEAAILEARKLTKGTKQTGTTTAALPNAAKTAETIGAVEDTTKAQRVARTVIDKSIVAGDMNSGFNKVGKLIDLSTPNPGDSSALEVELKIPFASAAGGGQGYFLFGFGGEAERETGELTVNTQVTFGAGFSTFGFDVNARFGLFLEGKGKDTSSVMNLLSYGLYRNMTQISSAAAGHFWGQSGKSGDSKLVEAEKWAMMIEEQHLDDTAEVNVGSLTKLAMEANVGVAGFSGELAYKRLSAYRKEIIAEKGKDAAGNLLSAADRVANNSIGSGESRRVYEAATEIEIGFGKDKVAFGVEGAMTRVGGTLRELNLELSASIPSQFGEEAGDLTQYAAKIVTAALGAGKNLTALFKKAMAAEPERAARTGGTMLDLGSDALFTGNYFDRIGASFAEQIQGDETINDTMRSWLPGQDSGASAIEQVNKIALSNALKLAASFKRQYDESGTPSEWEIAIEASQVKSLEVDAEIAKVAIEKSKRIGKVEFAKGKTTKYEFLGLERGGT
ncbi:hypothetical protein [Paenibacillus sp. y28]|uniref:hypothetical protein n=1 Tax=Paenibacillus sp. y28 TaxID=3129110 RepID=UPI00301B40EB